MVKKKLESHVNVTALEILKEIMQEESKPRLVASVKAQIAKKAAKARWSKKVVAHLNPISCCADVPMRRPSLRFNLQ